MTISVLDVYNFIDEIAPFETALDFDNTGILVGDKNAVVNKIGVCLDITERVISDAIHTNCNLIISHHPIIFSPLKSVTSDNIAYKLISNNISAICAHTNLDAAAGGVNDCLSDLLGLSDIIEVADPKYENAPPIARLGVLPKAMEPDEFAAYVKEKLDCPDVRFCTNGKTIQKVGVCGGASSEMLETIFHSNADAFVTSEVKHHEWLIANNLDFTVIDAGHFSTEYVVVAPLSKMIKDRFNLTTLTFTQHPPYKTK